MLNSTHNIEINVSIRTIHQSRTQRGQAGNQIQRTLITTVNDGEFQSGSTPQY